MEKSFSKKINLKEKQKILKYMNSHLAESKNKSIEFFFKTKKYSISIYYSNTLLIQGSEYQNILKIIGIEPILKTTPKINITIGTDESGNGDLFGGISVSSVRIPKENRNILIEMGVTDSKKLSDQFMKKIYKDILLLTQNSILNINVYDYNNMYKKYSNVNTIKTFGHNKVIKNICSKNDVIIIDQYTNMKSYEKHMKILNEKIDYNMFLETKAESKYLEVACASILARVNFLYQIEEIEKKIKIKIPLGSVNSIVNPTLQNIKTKKIDLSKCIKEHFKNNN